MSALSVVAPMARRHDSGDTAAPRLLVVDDEPELREMLAGYLQRQGCNVVAAGDGAQARQAIAGQRFDLVVLDVNMPGENGFALARWLREVHPATSIVMLTAQSDAIDRVLGLELGADDYLPKPFEPRELLARVRAVLRRLAASAQSLPPTEPAAPATRRTVAFGACRLDLDQRSLLSQDGTDIAISAAEFDLLELFARHPHRPLSRDQIMEQAHHRDWDVFDRSVDLRIMRLRRKIERNPDVPEVLKTVRSVGYVFVPSIAAVIDAGSP